ncbi:hypothetical protein ASG56_14500 [Rhodococcus sp. Leaf7]|nr:hypothetical protein RU01_04985 [Rhodococcus sp. MEB064]KQU04539.1 hypothetical protein ASG56_14500 [Rhodococcus sp. Leaf7]KQU40725.1 hypothetical protein ASG64_14490 [Rhodococcus sp. Leaf247]
MPSAIKPYSERRTTFHFDFFFVFVALPPDGGSVGPPPNRSGPVSASSRECDAKGRDRGESLDS